MYLKYGLWQSELENDGGQDVLKCHSTALFQSAYTICPADNATAGSLGRRRAGQLRFGFVAVSAGHIV
jgi:hypothetical protein